MSDMDAFEARFVRAYGRFLDEAPIELDAVALAQGAIGHHGPRLLGWSWPIRPNRALLWVALVALTVIALLAAFVVGSRRIHEAWTLTIIPAPAEELSMEGVAAGSADEAWVWEWTRLFHVQDGTWTPIESTGPVRAVHQTADGTLWLTDGLSGAVRRLDGSDWVTVDAGPAAFTDDMNGSVLIATRNHPVPPKEKPANIVRSLARVNGTWTETRVTPPTLWRPDLSGCWLGALTGDDGSVWLASQCASMFDLGKDEFLRFQNDAWEPAWPPTVGASSAIDWLAKAPDGSIWIAGHDAAPYGYGSDTLAPPFMLGWLARYDGTSWAVFDMGALPRTQAFSIAPDSSMWVARDDGVARFDGRSWAVVAEGSPVSAIDVARDGAVWITGPFGLARIQGSGSAATAPVILPPPPTDSPGQPNASGS